MIAITGATGTIGSELIRLLSEADVQARAITRDPSGQSELPNIKWIKGDLSDPKSLKEAFSGCEKLFLLTGNTENMVKLQKNAIQASKEAGISHVVKLSALGSSEHSMSVIGVWHYIVEQYLNDSGLDWTILRPHVFMQNLLDQKESIAEEGVFFSPSGNAEIPLIDTRDIAAVAKEILTDSNHRGETYTLSGPESISYHECAMILSEVLGKRVKYYPESFDEAWTRMRSNNIPIFLISGQLALASYHRAGRGTQVITDAVKRITGHEAQSFRVFADNYFG